MRPFQGCIGSPRWLMPPQIAPGQGSICIACMGFLNRMTDRSTSFDKHSVGEYGGFDENQSYARCGLPSIAEQLCAMLDFS